MKEENEIAKEIMKIQEDLGMIAKSMAKGMGITIPTFDKKRSPKALNHSFNQKNLDDLKSFLKNYVKKL